MVTSLFLFSFLSSIDTQLSIDGSSFFSFLYLVHQETKWHFKLLNKYANLLQDFNVGSNSFIPLLNNSLGLEHWVLFVSHSTWSIGSILTLSSIEVSLSKFQIFVGIHDIAFKFFFSEQ